MAYGYKNLSGSIYVRDFRIVIGVPGLSSDKTQAVIPYRGYGDPNLPTTDITAYQYSMDNGVTWATMSTPSTITGLAFTSLGPDYSFVWNINSAIGALQYNNYIRIRLQATSGALVTAYATYTLFFEKIVTNFATRRNSQFPADYKGIPASDLMAKAPKAM